MVIAQDVRKTSLRLTIRIFQTTVWYLGNLDKLNAGANENCEMGIDLKYGSVPESARESRSIVRFVQFR